jgi:hypothetical protein
MAAALRAGKLVLPVYPGALGSQFVGAELWHLPGLIMQGLKGSRGCQGTPSRPLPDPRDPLQTN